MVEPLSECGQRRVCAGFYSIIGAMAFVASVIDVPDERLPANLPATPAIPQTRNESTQSQAAL
jgi:hypothetical protein